MKRRFTSLILVVMFIGAAGAAVARRADAPPPDLCERAAHKAARTTGVPVQVLLAISLTETGRKQASGFGPWPWTLNIAGEGFFFDTPAAALARAERSLRSGQTSFDVGCFQVNYRWHGDAFASLAEMLEPDRNALYAAQFLAALFAESGDWTVAAGHYHSRTKVHADRYRKIFTRHLARLGPLDHQAPLPASDAMIARVNRFPLLQAGAPSATMGSLVPDVAVVRGGLFADHDVRALWSR
ncbi:MULTISPECIES: lytic transglycosylase domain-containing protein [unclassified Meridianimarinicoccus]|uniref:lytic transglycosylase domain-containing protein n=1 Tax=unclassified Meridianimarinicoccus TaxID=2923344 RepID=UPI001868A688|nr:lytic transglycosylase domain-containing protein [Fluviibacterium sp. MJW13]